MKTANDFEEKMKAATSAQQGSQDFHNELNGILKACADADEGEARANRVVERLSGLELDKLVESVKLHCEVTAKYDSKHMGEERISELRKTRKRDAESFRLLLEIMPLSQIL